MLVPVTGANGMPRGRTRAGPRKMFHLRRITPITELHVMWVTALKVRSVGGVAGFVARALGGQFVAEKLQVVS